MRRIVLCDVDHTVSDAAWRDGMIGGPGGYDAYHAEGDKDEPLLDTIYLVNAMVASGLEVIGLTARPQKWHALTMSWLVRNSVFMSSLIMRPEGCFLPSPQVKVQEVRRKLPNFLDSVLLVMDDRDDVCAAFRGLGLTVHQVFARRSK